MSCRRKEKSKERMNSAVRSRFSTIIWLKKIRKQAETAVFASFWANQWLTQFANGVYRVID
jgi:hypothetical protein